MGAPAPRPTARAVGAGYLRAGLVGDADALAGYRFAYTETELLDSVLTTSLQLLRRVASYQEMPVQQLADVVVTAADYLDQITDHCF